MVVLLNTVTYDSTGGYVLMLVTPATDGTFTVHNLPPGTVYLYPKGSYPRAGWAVQVPAAGETWVKLPYSTPPIRIALPANTTELAAVWWLQQDGPPCPLPFLNVPAEGLPAEPLGRGERNTWLQCSSYHLALGPGHLWVLDTNS
jgi:hypothetical protein